MVPEQQQLHSIGQATWRRDGQAKVTGAEEYVSDITLPRMWHARVLRSPYAHARIVHVDTSYAEALGAVCLTHADIPKIRYNERIVSTPPHLYRDRYVLADKARHVGEAIAAVAAPTEAAAEQALRALRVEYEVLETITDPEVAMWDGTEPIYTNVQLGDQELSIEHNIAVQRTIELGDIEHGFANSAVILEREFATSRIYHAQMETKGVVCRPESDGGITVWPTAQSIHNVRQLLGEIYSLPLHKINVKRVPIGGTFGSSIQMNSVIPICVGLTLKSGKTIKLVTTREEDMYDHVRYPSRIRLKLGATKDGLLTAGHMHALSDIGAHNTQAFAFLSVLSGWWASLYKLPAMKFEGKAVYTNKTPSCAMQGFGNPQATFAVESLMDDLADALGIDPVEFRLRNYVGLGGTFWGQGPSVQSIVLSDGVPELLEKGMEKIGWPGRPVSGSQTGRYRRGIGMARGFHTSGAGAPKPGEVIDYSGAFIKVNEDGTVDVVHALMDHGGGTLDAIAKIVAEELGIPSDRIGISPADTLTTVYDVVTHATRGVYAGGGAAHKAARKVKAILLDYASRVLGIETNALVIEPDETLGQGVIYCPSFPERRITVGALAKLCQTNSWGSIAAVESLRQVNCPPAYVAYFVEVEVDTETGSVRTVRAVIGSDCGTVVNPDLAVGQLEGGLSKGLGYALVEDNSWEQESGRLLSKGFWVDGKTPAMSESPLLEDIDTFFADSYEPSGPFGAKGIGEAATNPCAAAYGNALYNALGIRFTELPITPERIVASMVAAESGATKAVLV
ncbi:MAG: xanthine dehydrogenase family protein molybdopterin-binding subunit [Dehalococcoidia bacterium]|nr:xanthine dehydrogenase family protein molybdopterin-binding subunit [Dehalococcoidia bacterium]